MVGKFAIAPCPPTPLQRANLPTYGASLRRPSPIDDQRRAGHQRGSVGGEEDDRAGDFLELAEAAELDLAQHLVAERLVLKERARHRRLQERRPEAVDADVVRRELDR